MKTPFRLQSLVQLCAVATLTTVAAASALAVPVSLDVTRGAVAVTTTMGLYNSVYAVKDLIDQSGLSSPYVSGVTAFDSFVTSALHDSGRSANVWGSSSGTTTGYLSFDLGATYHIDGLAWFGLISTSAARVSGIKVYADNDSDATNGNAGLLFDSGTFGAAAGSSIGSALMKANVFSFTSAADTRYLDIEIVSNDGASLSGLGEVVFRQTTAADVPPIAAVPEPGTYALASLGLLALGVTRRRRVTKR